MSALGERFRSAREARGLSLSDVSEQIRIRSVYLAAIEDENWSAIGAPVYSRGFLRTYARYLGLDPEEVVAEFNRSAGSQAAEATTAQPVERERATASDRSSRSLSPFIWVAGLVAVVLIAFVFYNELTMRGRSAVAVTAAASPDETSATASPASSLESSSPVEPTSAASAASPAASGAHSLRVTLTSSSWLRVTVDGNVSMEGTFPAGTVREFRGKRAALRIGNAGGVDVLVDGKSVGKLGSDGDVVERSFTL